MFLSTPKSSFISLFSISFSALETFSFETGFSIPIQFFPFTNSSSALPFATMHAGVACVVAKSFARIFFRNAINIGLPLIEADIDCQEGDEIRVDLLKGEVTVQGKGTFKGSKLPDFLLHILADGGLVAHRMKIQKEQVRELV